MRPGSAFRLLMALLVAVGPSALAAQSFDLDQGRLPMVAIDGQWRFHPGDSPILNGAPAWADPEFNDSAWPLIHADGPWSTQGFPAMSGYAWYRCTLKVPPGDKPTSVLLAPVVTSFVLYADGKPVGGDGSLPTNTPSTSFSFKLYPLTTAGSPSPRTVHIAIRVFHSPMWAEYMGGGIYQPGSLAGDSTLLAGELRHRQASRNIRFAGYFAYCIISGIVGLVILYLFFTRPMEREYLWFALLVLAQCAGYVLAICLQIWAFPPIPVNDFIDGALTAVTVGATYLFISLILDAPIGTRGRILLGLLVFAPFFNALYWTQWASVPTSAALELLVLLPAILWPIYLLIRRAIQGNRDARLLLLPILAASGYYAIDNFDLMLYQAGVARRPEFMDALLPIPPFALRIQVFLDLVFILAMLIFLIRRFSLARSREERLAAEFEAARQVQQVLLPDELDACPGFQVECVYEPAEQVGGDFFQQIADSEGGMTIVVGDVSGKGLSAAMIVSVLVGAIRTEAAHGAGPATLLACLNQRMMGRAQGGFVTCLAAHLTCGGLLTIANAGHLPPYINGEELPAPGSLPLGLLEQTDFDLMTIQLNPGDRLMFLSDGVVEAQNARGELFGFDRTRALSMRSAEDVAQAAKAFGQEDDITVLAVTFAPAEVLHASSTAQR